MCVCACSVVFSSFVNPWTIAHLALLSVEVSDKNTGVSCYFLLQGIFLPQGWDLCFLHLLHWQAGSLHCASWEACVSSFGLFREPLVSLKYGCWVSLQGLAVLFQASWGYAKGTGSHGNSVWIFIQMNTCCHCSLSIL